VRETVQGRVPRSGVKVVAQVKQRIFALESQLENLFEKELCSRAVRDLEKKTLFALIVRGWDLAEWLERLAVKAKVGHNNPGFDPSILRHSVTEGRQMKQC
jgi:hypothetical protein